VNKLKTVLLSAVLLCAALSAACGGGSSQPQSGFKVQGLKYVQVVGGGFSLVSSANVRGTWQYDIGSAVGNTRSFGPLLCIGGPCPVNDGRVPARWQILAGTGGECIGQLTDPNMDVYAGQTKTARCLVSGIIFPFATSPAPVNLQAVPGSFDMTGSNLDTTYGMPRVEYFDAYSGNIVGTVDATAVSADGSWLQAPAPDLSQVYSGSYNILISNRQADGSLAYVGTSSVDTYGRDFVFEPPPDPCGGGEEPNPYNNQMERPIGGCY